MVQLDFSRFHDLEIYLLLRLSIYAFSRSILQNHSSFRLYTFTFVTEKKEKTKPKKFVKRHYVCIVVNLSGSKRIHTDCWPQCFAMFSFAFGCVCSMILPSDAH